MDYTIIMNLKNKTCKVKKTIAFRETAVPVKVVGLGSHVATNLRLRLIKNGVNCAEISALSVSGNDAIGTLDLNKTPIETVFDGKGDQATQVFTLCITDKTDRTLCVNYPIVMMNNPDADDLDPASAVISAFASMIQGSDTIANILAKAGMEIGHTWIATDTNAGASVPGVSGDGYIWDGTGVWRNVGQIRGPVGQTGAPGADGVDGADGKDGKDGKDLTYDSGTTYDLNEFCSDGGFLYKSLQNANTGHTPLSSPTWEAYSSGPGGGMNANKLTAKNLYGGI